MQALSGRRHRVEELAFSHDGRWIAAGGRSGPHIWDTTNPTAKPQNPKLPGLYQRAQTLCFHPDGRLFLQDGPSRWYIYDPEAKKRTDLGGRRVCTVVPSPDGQRVVRIHEPSPLRIWKFGAKDKLEAESEVPLTTTYVVTAAFSPDGSRLATAEIKSEIMMPGRVYRQTQALTLRTARTGKPTRTLRAVFARPDQLLFSHDGERLFARTAGSFACWTLAEPDKSPKKAVNPARKHFLSMAYHREGKLLTVDNDRLVRVWDAATLRHERAIEWNIGKLYAVAVSPDGTRAAVGSHTGKVLVWDWD
jgi:WD40 repeat protein